MLNPQTKLHTPACPKCQARYPVKKGKRRNRLQILQLYQCAECLYRFTGSPGRNKTYPLKHILEAISTYNLGHSISETQRMLRRRTHLDVPEGTARSWLESYRSAILGSMLFTKLELDIMSLAHVPEKDRRL